MDKHRHEHGGAEPSDDTDRDALRAPDQRAAISGEPRPFWAVWTTVASPGRRTRERAAAADVERLGRDDHKVAVPDPSVVVDAWMGTVRRSEQAPRAHGLGQPSVVQRDGVSSPLSAVRPS